VEANSTGGQGSRRAVAPSDDDDELYLCPPPPGLNALLQGELYLYYRALRCDQTQEWLNRPRDNELRFVQVSVLSPLVGWLVGRSVTDSSTRQKGCMMTGRQTKTCARVFRETTKTSGWSYSLAVA
jgi:hypothetical protein